MIRFPDGGLEVRPSDGSRFDYAYSFPTRLLIGE